jgi:hypothetical protein
VPAARSQTAKDASPRCIQIEMKRLRIEVLREVDNALFGHLQSAGVKAIADVQVFQEFFGYMVHVLL